MAKIVFIGPGVVGCPMAGRLRTRRGHDVTVYNRIAEKASNRVREYGGR